MDQQCPRSTNNWLDEVIAEAALILLWVGGFLALHLERVS